MDSNQDIIAGFEELFGGTAGEEPEVEETETTEEVEETEGNEEGNEEGSEEITEETEDQQEEKPEESPEEKQKSRQNYEFARLRTENKKQANLLKNLGKAIGLDPKSTPEEVADKVAEILLQKEAKEKNIPVEIMQRLQELESIAAENTRVKIENETQKAFTNLAEKYNLESGALTAFAHELAANGKNPFDGVEVDIEAEYIKLHHSDIVKAAVEAALNEENQRKKKVEEHAGSRVPGSSTESGDGGKKIESVADLDRYFSTLTL